MNVQILTETINRLIEDKEYHQALLLANHHLYHQNNTAFNDAYATLLYCTNQFASAKKVADFNIKILHQKPVNHPMLLSAYFLRTLCLLAENDLENAQLSIKKCLQLTKDNAALHTVLRQLFTF